MKIPIYEGALEPLVSVSRFATKVSLPLFHGNDGLGDRPNIYPEPNIADVENTKNQTHAANFIVEIVEKYPGGKFN